MKTRNGLFSPLTSLNKRKEGIKIFLAEKRAEAGDTINFSHLSCTTVHRWESYTGNLGTGHQMDFFLMPSEITKWRQYSNTLETVEKELLVPWRISISLGTRTVLGGNQGKEKSLSDPKWGAQEEDPRQTANDESEQPTGSRNDRTWKPAHRRRNRQPELRRDRATIFMFIGFFLLTEISFFS